MSSIDLTCRGCGAQLDCENIEDSKLYSLDNAGLPFILICPPGFGCNQGNSLTLQCCNQQLSVTFPRGATTQVKQALSNSLMQQCQILLASCGGTKQNMFYNTPQTCSVACPDGTLFSYTVQAGAVAGPDVATANRLAQAQACALAKQKKVCPKGSATLVVTDSNHVATNDFTQQDDMLFVLTPHAGTPPGTAFTLHPTAAENPHLFYATGPTLVYDGHTPLVFDVVDSQGVNIPGIDTLSFQARSATFDTNTVAVRLHNFPAHITVNAAFQAFWAAEIAAAMETTNWTDGVLPDIYAGGGRYFFNDTASNHTILIYREINGQHPFGPNADTWGMIIVGSITDYIGQGPSIASFALPSSGAYNTSFSDFTPPDPSPWTVA